MEEIKLTDTVSIYRTNIEYNKQQLIKEIYFNIEFNDNTYNESSNKNPKLKGVEHPPGIQSIIVINSKNIEYIKNEAVKFIKQTIYKNNDLDYCQTNWIYFTDKNEKIGFWHEHQMNTHSSILNNEWTYTFYAQMPNNLDGDDGKLFFKIEDDKEYSILPIEGDIILFPADLLHMPKLSPNSSKERIVIGGNFVKIDVDNPIKKRKTTLI